MISLLISLFTTELITHVFGQKALNEDQADSPAISSSFPTSANNDNDDDIITKRKVSHSSFQCVVSFSC